MNSLTKTLLGGVALCGLTSVPAIAENAPAFHVAALHGGRVVNKTTLHNPDRQHLTYTLGIYTSVPASDLNTKVKLTNTFYKWNSIANACSSPKEKLKVPKKSIYAKLGPATETYSLGCSSGPTVFYGDSYKLTDKAGFGQTDSFVSTLYGRWKKSGVHYKGTLKLDVSVAIGN